MGQGARRPPPPRTEALPLEKHSRGARAGSPLGTHRVRPDLLAAAGPILVAVVAVRRCWFYARSRQTARPQGPARAIAPRSSTGPTEPSRPAGTARAHRRWTLPTNVPPTASTNRPGEKPKSPRRRTSKARSLETTRKVGVPGFEPGTFGPPDRRANQAAPHPVEIVWPRIGPSAPPFRSTMRSASSPPD